jgi:hypothetical protein
VTHESRVTISVRFRPHKSAAQVEIRVFKESDELGVIALWKSVFGYSEPRNDPAAVIRQKLACQQELFFVATHGGTVVGTVMGGMTGTGVGFIRWPSVRNFGSKGSGAH